MSEEVVDRGEAPPRYAEQITRDPPKEEEKTAGKKAKNPKKVEAGKKLAEYNKKAKEALAREMKREKEQEEIKNEENSNQDSEPKAWLPELSFTTVLSIIGIGFTAFDMFMRYRQKEERMPACSTVSQVPQRLPPQNIPAPQPQKMGMI